MRNRNVGYLIVGISVIIIGIIIFFNIGLRNIVSETCSHGPTCTMYDTISMQTWLSVAIASLILLIGLFLIFVKEEKQIIIKKIKEPKRKISLNGLDNREKEAVKIIQETGGIFQAELMEKLGVGKVGVTRLLDKLEAKQIVERKRRGMNNFVVLKN
jgi:H+/Cl- antiporter ClcA